MRKRILSCLAGIIGAATLLSIGVSAAPYISYNYVENGSGIQDVLAPNPYLPEKRLTEKDLGVALEEPSDLFHSLSGDFYLSDAKKNAVFCFDSDWKLKFTINDATAGDNQHAKLVSPNGLFVTDAGQIFVADTQNHRVAVYDKNGKYEREILLKENSILPDDYVFEPLKLVVAESGSVFVAASGALEGLMEISNEGELHGFIGSNTVSFNPLEIIWRKIFTDKQKSQLIQYVPVEYKNIAMDDMGLLYTVTDVTDASMPVKRLNQSGDDVLLRNSTLSDNSIAGDLLYPTWYQLENYGPSTLVDIVSGQDGLYYVLDGKRGRVFAYDEDGNMLFEFGGKNSEQDGMVDIPVAIEIDGSDILILDKQKKTVNIFSMTSYTEILTKAQRSYREGDYDISYDQWLSVLNQNSNFNLAYVKAGYCLFRQEKYKEAMDMFQLGNARDNYSKAFVKYRREHLNQYFPIYFIVVLLVIALLVWLSIRRRKKEAALSAASHYDHFISRTGKIKQQFQFALKTAFHPYRGFSSIKEENSGTVTGALGILILLFLSMLLCRQVRAFLFNTNYNSPIDFFYELRLLVIPVVLFVIANWSVTTLMDGKGNMREIFIVVGTSCLPLVFIPAIVSFATRVMTLNEVAFVTMGDAVAWLWMGVLLFIGIKEIHQYSFSRTIVVFLLTVVSAVIIVFICLLFFSLLQEISGFVYSIYKEIMLRS